MKPTFFFLVLTLLACSTLIAQEYHFKNGVYRTLDDLIRNTPYKEITLEPIKRPAAAKTFGGGQDYKLVSNNHEVSIEYIKNDIYAYVINDSIFLNGKKYQLQPWFALNQTKGNFLVFSLGITKKKAIIGGVIGGLLGGVILGAVIGMVDNRLRNLQVLSLRTGNLKPLTKEYVRQRLKESSPKLLELFDQEKEPDSDETLIEYINDLNKIVPIESNMRGK